MDALALIVFIVLMVCLISASVDKAGCDKDGPHSPVE